MTLLESAWQRRGSENLARREDTSLDKGGYNLRALATRAASPGDLLVPRAGSPRDKNVPRVDSPEYKKVPRAASPRYIYFQ